MNNYTPVLTCRTPVITMTPSAGITLALCPTWRAAVPLLILALHTATYVDYQR